MITTSHIQHSAQLEKGNSKKRGEQSMQEINKRKNYPGTVHFIQRMITGPSKWKRNKQRINQNKQKKSIPSTRPPFFVQKHFLFLSFCIAQYIYNPTNIKPSLLFEVSILNVPPHHGFWETKCCGHLASNREF